MRTRPAAAVVSAVLLLAACSQEVHGVASPGGSSTPPSSGSPAPSPPSEEQPGGEQAPGTEEKSGSPTPGGSGDPAAPRVTGINVQSDDYSARLVVNLGGGGVPEWTVAYSEATGPDGEAVAIAGDAFLRVRVRTGGGGSGQASSRVSVSPGPVAEARTTGAADGYEEVLIGVRGGEQPFTVEALTDPGRLAIEVRTAG